MRIAILALCLCLLLVSCKRNSHPEYAKQILGEWKLVGIVHEDTTSKKSETSVLNFFWGCRSGYIFRDNNICEKKGGVFNLNKEYSTPFNTLTTYKIIDDSIHIVIPDDKTGEGLKIHSIIGDTMYVNSFDRDIYSALTYYKYVKQHYKANPSITFDAIILSAYSFWGLSRNVMVNKNGEVLSLVHQVKGDSYFHSKQTKGVQGQIISIKNGDMIYKIHYDEKYINYHSKIAAKQFNSIKEGFQKTNFNKLKDEYEFGGADGPEIMLSFIKNNKIIKSIHVYDKRAPAELIWAYLPLQYLYQQIKLDTLSNDPIPLNLQLSCLETSNKTCSLNPSERFYLLNLIRYGQKTEKEFSANAILDVLPNKEILKIETEGQFYRFLYKNGTKKTYDIGFNFIERNKGVLKFKDKPKEKHAAN